MSKFNKNLQKAISISSTILGSILLFGVIGFFLKINMIVIYFFTVSLILDVLLDFMNYTSKLNK